MKSSEAMASNVVTLPVFDRAARRARWEFLPAALEVIETPASPLGRAVAITLMAVFVVAIVWSVVGHVDIVATASGKVVPTGRTKTVQPLESGIVSAIPVQDGDRVAAGQVVVRLDQTVALAERSRIAHDLIAAKLDVARMTALRAGIEGGAEMLLPPEGASDAQIVRTRAAMTAQSSAQRNKIASIDQQIAQKLAEANVVAGTIEKLQFSLPLVAEQANIRRKAVAIEYGNRIAHLDAEIRLADQTNELVVQRAHALEVSAARLALEGQRAQAVSEYAQKVLSDLAEAEQKVADLGEDLSKAQQKLDQTLLRGDQGRYLQFHALRPAAWQGRQRVAGCDHPRQADGEDRPVATSEGAPGLKRATGPGAGLCHARRARPQRDRGRWPSG
jgi:hemolysin D